MSRRPNPPDNPQPLHTLRQLLGWSRAYFGEVLGISPSLVEKIEYGHRPLTLDLLFRLHVRLGCDLDLVDRQPLMTQAGQPYGPDSYRSWQAQLEVPDWMETWQSRLITGLTDMTAQPLSRSQREELLVGNLTLLFWHGGLGGCLQAPE